MEEAQTGGWIKRKRIGLGSLLILTLLCGAGLIYIGQQGSNRKQSFFPFQERLSEGQPVKQVEKPAQANVLSPSFDIASVDERGKLVAAGRSEAGWIIQLKSETQILAETKADENNEWVLTPEASLAPGEHTLSLVAIDPSGQRSVAGKQDNILSVPARRETVRQTETPVQRRQAPSWNGTFAGMAINQGSEAGRKDCAFAVVKRGDTLWGIAHHCYGNGTKYSKIFRSNRSLIRSPDLIYPDQKFALPD